MRHWPSLPFPSINRPYCPKLNVTWLCLRFSPTTKLLLRNKGPLIPTSVRPPQESSTTNRNSSLFPQPPHHRTRRDIMSSSSYHNLESPEMEKSHEMETLQAPSSPNATRRRVRINSSAATIPRARSASASCIEDVESNLIGRDSTHAEADGLLAAHSAHRRGASVPEPRQNTLPEDSHEEYSYTGGQNGGLFYQLLQAYQQPAIDTTTTLNSTPPPQFPEPTSRPGSSGNMTPRKKKWYDQEKEKENRSQETLATLIGAAAALTNPNTKPASPTIGVRRAHNRSNSNPILSKIFKAKDDQEVKIKLHVATILRRQQYLIKMCRALMLFGAPTHRLEEYLAMSAKVLEINSQFLYIPGKFLSADLRLRIRYSYRSCFAQRR
jgi:hypothetical protein